MNEQNAPHAPCALPPNTRVVELRCADGTVVTLGAGQLPPVVPLPHAPNTDGLAAAARPPTTNTRVPMSLLVRLKGMLDATALGGAGHSYKAWVLLVPDGTYPNGRTMPGHVLACDGTGMVALSIPGGYAGPRLCVRWTGKLPSAKALPHLDFDASALPPPGTPHLLDSNTGLCLHTADPCNLTGAPVGKDWHAYPSVYELARCSPGESPNAPVHLVLGLDPKLLAIQAEAVGDHCGFVRVAIPLHYDLLRTLADLYAAGAANAAEGGSVPEPMKVLASIEPLRVTGAGRPDYDSGGAVDRAILMPVRLKEDEDRAKDVIP